MAAVAVASNGSAGGDVRRRTRAEKNNNAKQNGSSANADNGPITEARVGDNYASASFPALVLIGVVRLSALLFWVGGITIATLELFVVIEEHMPFNRQPEMNPGLLSGLLGRGKDSVDVEWRVIGKLLWMDALITFGIGTVLEKLLSLCLNIRTDWISMIMSLVLLNSLFGPTGTAVMFLVPTVYWLALHVERKSLIWTMTVAFVMLMSSSFSRLFSDDGETIYLFAVISAWNISRCVSFCFDMWDREDKYDISALCSFYKYVFYLPFVVSGPIITFEHFEREKLKKTGTSPAKDDLLALLKGLFRVALYAILIEVILHFLYYESFAQIIPSYDVINSMNLWAICGAIYWLGQGFALKYKVLYGLPSCLAEFEGIRMYPSPCCPSYVHRHSVLWKDFDRGLYVFLVKYIYIPMIQYLDKNLNAAKMSRDVKKFCASTVTFAYVFIWHSLAYPVFVWTLLNFIGVTVERIGSMIKKGIDRRTTISPLVWDFVVEPSITVPLAAMSLLNSTVFCGNIYAATAMYHKLIATCTNANFHHFWIAVFLYCFCHVGVAVRTWKPFRNALLRQSATTHRHKS